MKKILLSLLTFLAATVVNAQSLVSMSPNSIVQGASQTITSTITGLGTLFQNGSPPNSLTDAYITNGFNTYYGDVAFLFPPDDEHVDIPFTLGVTPVIGSYDLTVTYYDPNVLSWPYSTTLTLPGAFTVIAPNGYVQGTVYEDLNQNGVQDIGEAGISGVGMTINPGNYYVVSTANGTFSYPLANGSYTLTYNNNAANYLFLQSSVTNPINFTINNGNSTGNDFPLYRGLNSAYPDSGWIGQTATINVYSDKGIFRPGNVSLGNGTRIITTNNFYAFNATQYTYIDTNHVQLKFVIPYSNYYLGNYNLEVTTTAPYNGKHKLLGCYTVVTPPAILSGTVFFDADSNGVKDPLEPGIQGQKILLMPDSAFAFSDANGNYFFGSNLGSKTISYAGGSPYLLQTNNQSSYTVNITGSLGGFKFGVKTTNPDYSCDVSPVYGVLRCNIHNYSSVYLQNTSNITYNAWFYVIKSSNINLGLNTNPPPTYTSGDTVAWYVTNLQPFETRMYNPTWLMPPAGSIISLKTVIQSLDASNNIVFTDSYTRTQIISCSYDPNDKTVTPEGVQAQHLTLMTDTLDYLVRFQNTGNDTAFVVVVRDTIDTNFDLSTFRVIGSSHVMNTELDLETRVAKFTFNNILLPDSGSNEIASHGFLRYTIMPKTGLPENTLVENDADIYFDFNPPVITNETFNTLVTTLAPTPDFASVDNRVCATQTVTFSNLTSGNATSYQWTFPGGTPSSSTAANPTIQYLVKGSYDVTLVATNATGTNSITKTAYVLIDSLSPAVVTPGGNSTICKGQNIVLSSQAQAPSFTYQWEKNNVIIPNATSATYIATQQATYRVNVTNGLGCTKRSVTKTVFTSQPTAAISANGATTFCSGGSVQLQTTSTVGNIYQWKKNNINISGANAFNYTASSNGSYRVLITNQNGCTNISGVIPVRVNANPNVTLNASGPLTFCAGQSVTLSVIPQANITYQWKNNNVNIGGATTNQYTATAAGKYRVSALNTVTSCSNQSSIKNVIVNCRVAGESNVDEVSLFAVSVYPNPSHSESKIYFELPDNRTVSIQMHDMTGRLIEILANDTLQAGAHELTLDAKKYPSGIYFITVIAGNEKQVIKFIAE